MLDSVFVKQNITADYQISSFDELHLDSSGTVGKPIRVLARKGTKSVSRPSGPVEGCCLTVGNDCGLLTVSALLEMAHPFTDNRAPVLRCQRQIYEFRH